MSFQAVARLPHRAEQRFLYGVNGEKSGVATAVLMVDLLEP